MVIEDFHFDSEFRGSCRLERGFLKVSQIITKKLISQEDNSLEMLMRFSYHKKSS